MIENAAQVAEILAVLYCLAGLFGRKMKFDIYAVILIIVDLLLLTGINQYDFPVYLMSFSYIGLFTYGMIHYKKGMKVTLVNCVLTTAITGVLQLIMYLPMFYLFISKFGVKKIYSLVLNIGCLVIVILFGNRLRLEELSNFFVRRNKVLIGVSIFILLTLGVRIYQMSKSGIMSNEDYIQTICFLGLFFFTVSEWQKSKSDAEKEKMKLEMNKLYYAAYDELITLVRERQHEMKNHLTAILGMIYTTDNFEELKRKQSEYCNYVLERNEETKMLLSTENPLIAGFLYRKVQEAENKGIEVVYRIDLAKEVIDVPEYEMVEMLGILIDNAMEALENKPEELKKMRVCIEKSENKMYFYVANVSDIYDIGEVEQFFKKDFSSKGKGRGIGLFKLRRLVNKIGGEIIVSNEIFEDENYLKFVITI